MSPTRSVIKCGMFTTDPGHMLREEDTMAEHPNVEVQRRGYDAFSKADFAALNDVFADGIVWLVSGPGPLAGTDRDETRSLAFSPSSCNRRTAPSDWTCTTYSQTTTMS